MLVWIYLNKQAVAYIKIGTLYTNKFLNKEMTSDDYNFKMSELKEGVNPLLRWYLKRGGYHV